MDEEGISQISGNLFAPRGVAIDVANSFSIRGVAMKNLILFCSLAVFAATTFAQEAKPVVLKGYVVDQMCAARMATKANVMEKASSHTKECALEDDCAGSGYGIFSEGKYYKFDEKGSAQAKALIEKSKRAKQLYFEVTGRPADGTFQVVSLKEATETKAEPKASKKT